jgi:hypothetical protein
MGSADELVMAPLLRATAHPPRSRRPTLARGLLDASGASASVASSLAACVSAARCFLDVKPPTILAFVVLMRIVVSPVTRHANKYCNNGDAHRAYQAPPAKNIATTRPHMALTDPTTQSMRCGGCGAFGGGKAAFGVLQWTLSLKCLKKDPKTAQWYCQCGRTGSVADGVCGSNL